MEARNYTVDTNQVRARLKAIRDAKDGNGGLSGVARETGINRALISRYVNGYDVLSAAQEELLNAYLDTLDSGDEETEPKETTGQESAASLGAGKAAQKRFGLGGGKIYYTRDYARAIGRLDEIRAYRAMCVMIGHPGTGKTTVLREYARTHTDTYYIDCWPVMSMRDLIEAIAAAIGITLKQGSRMRMLQQIIEAFDEMSFGDVLKYSIQAQRAAVYEYRYKDSSCVREEIDGSAVAEERMAWLRGLMRDKPELMAEIERSYDAAAREAEQDVPIRRLDRGDDGCDDGGKSGDGSRAGESEAAASGAYLGGAGDNRRGTGDCEADM